MNSMEDHNYAFIGNGYPNEKYCTSSDQFSKSEVDLLNHMRMLWEQHTLWTRMTIMSIAYDLPDVDLVTNRLLRNPMDFEILLRNFYGNKVASKFSNLLEEHLIIAAELVKAAKSGDNNTAVDAEKRWYANADEIANFLSSINPYWSQEDWKTMLYLHLALTKAEAVAIISKNYAESIALYDKIEMQGLEMADMMTEGIIR